MSLINQMLQELEARRTDIGTTEPYAQQIRAVPERRRMHPAWWVALALGLVLSGLLAWLVLSTPVADKVRDPRAELPLRLDVDLTAPIPPQHPAPMAVQPVAREMAAPQVEESIVPVAVQRGTPISTTVTATAQPVVVTSVPEIAKIAVTGKPVVETIAKQPETAPIPVVINKQVKDFTPQQRAENEYRKALQAHQQGRTNEAISGMEQALQLDAHHAAARQTLIGLMLESKRQDDAIRLAREGLGLDSSQPGLAMIFARLQVERGELRSAIETLERTLPHAADRADYHAFLAALLQRDERHKQAAERYMIALQKAPQNGVWWMGLGISLQAENRVKEAQDAFKRAKASNSLSPELQAFVDAKLSQLQH